MSAAPHTTIGRVVRSYLTAKLAGLVVTVSLITLAVFYAFGEMMLSAMGVTLSPAVIGTVQVVLGVLVSALLVYVLADSNVRAVARYTFIQCLRTRVAIAFIVLLAVLLAVLPLLMTGDGTLAGRIRTFLVYSTTLTVIILGLITVFLSAGLVSGDVAKKHIFLLAVKPLSRWEYLLGRWMGLVLLNLVLMGLAGGAIYGLAQHLRAKKDLSSDLGGPLNPNDYRIVETEIFTARAKVPPRGLNIETALEARLQKLQSEPASEGRFGNRYGEILNGYKESKARGDEREAERLMEEELRKQVTQEMQSLAPNSSRPLTWTFSGIRHVGSPTKGQGRIIEISPAQQAIVVQATAAMTAHLVHDGPVWINQVQSKAYRRVQGGYFQVIVPVQEFNQPSMKELRVGQKVDVAIEPLVQLTYKATVGAATPDERVTGMWVFTNLQTGYAYYEPRRDPYNAASTITVPAKAVDADGNVQVQFFSRTPTSVSILQDELSLLYRTGGFELNFVRACLLALLGLAFLAALGLMAGSFVSFPVACLICFVILPYAIAPTFLGQATKVGQDTEWGMVVSHGAYRAMSLLLPDLGNTLPGDQLTDGLRISWLDLGQTAVSVVVVRAMLVLALACLAFGKRELARVQV